MSDDPADRDAAPEVAMAERVAMAMWAERRRFMEAGGSSLIPWDAPGSGGEHIRTQLRAMARAAVGAMAAAERVVAAAERCMDEEQAWTHSDAWDVAYGELRAAVAAYRDARDGGGG